MKINKTQFMTKAEQLSKIAKQNKNQQELVSIFSGDIFITSGTRQFCEEYINEMGGTFEIRTYQNPVKMFQQIVETESRKYVEAVIKKVEQLAKKGFGS